MRAIIELNSNPARGEDAIGGGGELPLGKGQGEQPRQSRDDQRAAKNSTSTPVRNKRRVRLRLVGFIAFARPFATRPRATPRAPYFRVSTQRTSESVPND